MLLGCAGLLRRTAASLSRKPAASSTTKHQFPPVNSVTLVGVVHDIQQGYLVNDPVTQFSITTLLANVGDDAAPEEYRLAPKSQASLSGMARAKESYTVRCVGQDAAAAASAAIHQGCVAEVEGQLVLNSGLDSVSGKQQFFPYVKVKAGRGSVRMLHGKKRSNVRNATAAGTTGTGSEAPS
jgi:hypothetical protein